MSAEDQELRQIFLLECEELVTLAEASVETLRAAPTEDAIHALFRAVHSIKGGAGAFGLDHMASFAHVFETYMDLLRKGKATLDDAAVDLLFDGVDVLRQLSDEARDGEQASTQRYEAALEALPAAAGLEEDAAAAKPPPADFDPMAEFEAQMAAVPAADEAPRRKYKIRFVPGPKMLEAGIDPLRILGVLKTLGDLKVEIAGQLPPLADLN
ncbi:MAG: Hpt domain-containing protein, partial [Alphaproteobacteria bacterium]|nr:Hpt domain-containing protein [Alphaproteobacteria bacterium]